MENEAELSLGILRLSSNRWSSNISIIKKVVYGKRWKSETTNSRVRLVFDRQRTAQRKKKYDKTEETLKKTEHHRTRTQEM